MAATLTRKDIMLAAVEAVVRLADWSPEAAQRLLQSTSIELLRELANLRHAHSERSHNQFVAALKAVRLEAAEQEAGQLRERLDRLRITRLQEGSVTRVPMAG